MFKFRKALTITVLSLAGVCLLAPVALAAAPAAQGTAELVSEAAVTEGASGDNAYSIAKYVALAMGLGLGLAAAGGSLGQGRAAAAALEGIARNPGASGKIFTPMILGLALIESLVIYSLVVSIMLNGHLSKIVEKALGG